MVAKKACVRNGGAKITTKDRKTRKSDRPYLSHWSLTFGSIEGGYVYRYINFLVRRSSFLAFHKAEMNQGDKYVKYYLCQQACIISTERRTVQPIVSDCLAGFCTSKRVQTCTDIIHSNSTITNSQFTRTIR